MAWHCPYQDGITLWISPSFHSDCQRGLAVQFRFVNFWVAERQRDESLLRCMKQSVLKGFKCFTLERSSMMEHINHAIEVSFLTITIMFLYRGLKLGEMDPMFSLCFWWSYLLQNQHSIRKTRVSWQHQNL